MTEFEYLTVDNLLKVATRVLYPAQPMLRDAGALASAAARPETTVFGEDAYPTLAAKAAALLHSLARNHPLVDGNKRLAWAASRTFLLLNGHDVAFPDVDAAEEFVLRVARGDADVEETAKVLSLHLTRLHAPDGNV